MAAEYFIDAAGTPGTGTAFSGGFGSPTVSVNAALTTTFAGLSQGQHTIYVNAKDAAGNWSSPVFATFVKDTVAPVVTLAAVATPTNNNLPTFTGTAGTVTGDSTTVTVNIYSGTTLVQTLTTGDSGVYSVQAASSLADGAYTAQASQSDAAGNTGTSGTIGFTIDTVAPTVTSVTSTASGMQTTGNVVPITVNFSEAVTVTGTPTLTLALTSGNIAVNYASGSGTTALVFNYTVAAGQSTSDLDYASTSALTGTIKDLAGNALLTSNALPATGYPLGGDGLVAEQIVVNTVPPVLTTSGSTLAYTESQSATAIDSGLTLNDTNVTNLGGATVAISANYAGGQDVLGFSNQNGITGSFNSTTGTLTLTGTSTVANYQTALRSVTFANTSNNPATAARTVTFVASDGANSSVPASDTVTVTGNNSAPTVTVPGSQSVNRDHQSDDCRDFGVGREFHDGPGRALLDRRGPEAQQHDGPDVHQRGQQHREHGLQRHADEHQRGLEQPDLPGLAILLRQRHDHDYGQRPGQHAGRHHEDHRRDRCPDLHVRRHDDAHRHGGERLHLRHEQHRGYADGGRAGRELARRRRRHRLQLLRDRQRLGRRRHVHSTGGHKLLHVFGGPGKERWRAGAVLHCESEQRLERRQYGHAHAFIQRGPRGRLRGRRDRRDGHRQNGRQRQRHVGRQPGRHRQHAFHRLHPNHHPARGTARRSARGGRPILGANSPATAIGSVASGSTQYSNVSALLEYNSVSSTGQFQLTATSVGGIDEWAGSIVTFVKAATSPPTVTGIAVSSSYANKTYLPGQSFPSR